MTWMCITPSGYGVFRCGAGVPGRSFKGMTMWTRLPVLAIATLGLSLPGQTQPPQVALSALPRAEIAVDMLSDKGGVDLNPYFEHLVSALNGNWQPLVRGAAE